MNNLVLTLPVFNDGLLFTLENISFALAILSPLAAVGLAFSGRKYKVQFLSAWCLALAGFPLIQTVTRLNFSPVIQYGIFAAGAGILLLIFYSVLSFFGNSSKKTLTRKQIATRDRNVRLFASLLAGLSIYLLVYRSVLVAVAVSLLVFIIAKRKMKQQFADDKTSKTYDDLLRYRDLLLKGKRPFGQVNENA